METFKRILKKSLNDAARIAVLGVGSDLRGDDCAGLLVAESLQRACGSARPKRMKVFFGGTAPENVTGEIKRYRPTHVVMIDSAEMGAPAGTVRLIDPAKVGGVSFCTHSLPLTVLTDYLEQELGCAILLIGIQPKAIAFSGAVAPQVKRASVALAGILATISHRSAHLPIRYGKVR